MYENVDYNRYISTKPFKKLIEERNISMSQISRDLGMSSRTMSNFSNGRGVNLTTVVRLCRYLEVPIEQVITVDYEKSPE